MVIKDVFLLFFHVEKSLITVFYLFICFLAHWSKSIRFETNWPFLSISTTNVIITNYSDYMLPDRDFQVEVNGATCFILCRQNYLSMFESTKYSVWQEGPSFVCQSFTKMSLGDTLELYSYSDYINAHQNCIKKSLHRSYFLPIKQHFFLWQRMILAHFIKKIIYCRYQFTCCVYYEGRILIRTWFYSTLTTENGVQMCRFVGY